MFTKIQHIGYQVRNLDAAIEWFAAKFGGTRAGGGPSRSGGRNAFVHFGQIEVELIEPPHHASLPKDNLIMHHVGYVVDDIMQAIPALQDRGFKFVADKPNTNSLGQQVLYFDVATTNGVQMHLTQQPAEPNTTGYSKGLAVQYIIHAGYLVDDLDEAMDWYIKKFDGAPVGGIGASRRGGRNGYVNFGQVQVELIESADKGALWGERYHNDHVGYVVADIEKGIAECRGKGMEFVANSPNTNRIGQQLLYMDSATTQGARMHLTQMPD